MDKKKFLTILARSPIPLGRSSSLTISTDADDFNESELSVKEAIDNSIENIVRKIEAQDNYEYGKIRRKG